MRIDVTSNATTVSLELDATGRRSLRAANKGLIAATRVLYDEDRRQINVIYARPIPRGKGRRLKGGLRGPKRPLWRRSGMLRRGEKMQYPARLESLISNVNDTPYAEARHELNRPGRDGVLRHDPWRRKTVAAKTGEAGRAFEKAFTEAMQA